MPIPEEAAPLLSSLPDALTGILGENLVGLYVYGSVLHPAFDPSRSDVDCIAVTARALTDGECRQLGKWLTERKRADPWVQRLELSLLLKSSVLAEAPEACLIQFGELKRTGSDGNPIIWLDFFQRGYTLCGAAPESFLPRITAQAFHRALIREIGYLREELGTRAESERRNTTAYRVYAVLTLCRILYSARVGAIASKAQAGQWALAHVPSTWHDLIHAALETATSSEREALVLPRLCAFVDYAQEQVDSTAPLLRASVP